MKFKRLQWLLLLSFQLGYLEWGKNQHAFIFELQYQIAVQALHNLTSVVHPFTLLPFLAQCLLIISTFPRAGYPKMAWISHLILAFLMLLLLLIGCAQLRYRMMASGILFWVIWGLLLKKQLQSRTSAPKNGPDSADQDHPANMTTL